jgi:hypothetical protein
MFCVSEMDWLESRYDEVIKISNMISDENGRWFCIEEAFKAIFYLFAGKSDSKIKMLNRGNKQIIRANRPDNQWSLSIIVIDLKGLHF